MSLFVAMMPCLSEVVYFKCQVSTSQFLVSLVDLEVSPCPFRFLKLSSQSRGPAGPEVDKPAITTSYWLISQSMQATVRHPPRPPSPASIVTQTKHKAAEM